MNLMYEIRFFAADERPGNVIVYAVLKGTHTGEGGHVEDDRIGHIRKFWNDGISMKQIGWA